MAEVKAAQITQRAASSGTLAKLVVFSVSLGVVPLGSYYGSLHYAWDGNTTYAAITAIVAANIVLVAYIVASVLEDRGTQPSASTTKKTQ